MDRQSRPDGLQLRLRERIPGVGVAGTSSPRRLKKRPNARNAQEWRRPTIPPLPAAQAPQSPPAPSRKVPRKTVVVSCCSSHDGDAGEMARIAIRLTQVHDGSGE